MGRTLLTDKSSVNSRTFDSSRERKLTAGSPERLREARSYAYLDAIRQLDSGGAVVSADRLRAIRDAIASEFPGDAGGWPLGWVSKCYLGVPYEVHMVDLSGQIVEHFKIGEAMPGGLERARSLAVSGLYLVIEVFADRMIAIAADGTTSVASL